MRVMCITDQMKACNVDTLAAVEASLSDEAKGILRERTGQLRNGRYGTHNYVAMLGWLQNTQHNNRSLNACTAGSTGSSCMRVCRVCPRVERGVHHGDSEIIDERRRHGTRGKAAGRVVDLEEEPSRCTRPRVRWIRIPHFSPLSSLLTGRGTT